MASNAERQGTYLEQHLVDIEGTGARININVDHNTKLAFERLAVCYGVTQRTMLERLIGETDKNLLIGVSGKNQQRYCEQQLSMV